MSTSVSVLRAKIERIVRRDLQHPDADFFHLRDGGRWLAAQAWFTSRGPRVAPRGGQLTLEEAALVGVALQMAIDWVVEECQRKEDFGPNGDATTPGFFK